MVEVQPLTWGLLTGPENPGELEGRPGDLGRADNWEGEPSGGGGIEGGGGAQNLQGTQLLKG